MKSRLMGAERSERVYYSGSVTGGKNRDYGASGAISGLLYSYSAIGFSFCVCWMWGRGRSWHSNFCSGILAHTGELF